MRAQAKFRHGICLLTISVVMATPAFSQRRNNQRPNQLSDIELRRRISRALTNGCEYLVSQQRADGAWRGPKGGRWPEDAIGYTALAIMALVNNDYQVDSPEIERGLAFLRSTPIGEPSDQHGVYQSSLMIMALCSVKQPNQDRARIERMARQLIDTQAPDGMWGYYLEPHGRRNGQPPGNNREDRSNTQFALLALRDAAYYGVEVEQEVWQKAHKDWVTAQLPGGAWGYREKERGSADPKGSMTAAGLSSLAITSRMLQTDDDVDGEGRPDCCAPHPPEPAFERGRQWLGSNFTVTANPKGTYWHYYYLYGLERAGRLGNVRYFGDSDWYRQGAAFLVAVQNGNGSWNDRTISEPLLATSYALLFLSKGLSRVIINKLDYTSSTTREDTVGDWNNHPLDIPNLVEKVGTMQGWPPRMTSQVLRLSRLRDATAVRDLNQARVLYISGKDRLSFTDTQIRWLREYIDEGGFIFAVANCRGQAFDEGFRDVVKRMFPDGDAALKRLAADHPVYRSEFAFPNADTVELYGVDFGCRTAIIYSPEDLGCLWQKWMHHEPRGRHPGLTQRIIRANRIGVNVLAYATEREPPIKLQEDRKTRNGTEGKILRGLTEIAQLRHTGGWDTAPKALRNLLQGLNETAGLAVSPQRRTIPITFDELSRFPIAYMHGRYRFRLGEQEQEALKKYLSRGTTLIADSCCGSKKFDRSFRDLMSEMYPDHPLERIPADHLIYSKALGGPQVDQVRLRKLVPAQAGASLKARVETVPPMLEGIEIDGRYVVIYSRYDISCALENQTSLACDGYEEQDAMKLGIKVVLYSMLQEISGKAGHWLAPNYNAPAQRGVLLTPPEVDESSLMAK